jgi:hypothetical protein
VPAAFWLAWSPPQGPPGTLARLFILLAACWFTVLSFALLSLWLLPRYQIVTVCALAVPAALLLGDWLNRGFRIRVAMLLIAVLGAGLVLSSAADHDLLFGERALVNFLRLQNEPVRTDPATLRGAEWLLQSAGVADRVTVGLPVSGGLYFINHSPRRAMPPDWPIQDEVPGSVVVASFTQKLGRLAIIAAALGLDRVMPVSLWRKIHPTPRRAEIVRMP